MSFDWREFLKLAQDLGGRNRAGYSSEACNRTAISRAYYAAFCFTRNYAEAHLEFRPERTVKDHSKLREYFTRLGGKWAEIAEKLDELRKWRNKCDYEDTVSNLSALIKYALANANEVFGYYM